MKNLLEKRKASSGFTIIEVIIVLAIAGLIMVIVFIAIPQLQRNQRDNARQNVANRIEAEMETYAGNNQGAYPVGAAPHDLAGNFTTNYYNNLQRQNPRTGNNYALAIAAAIGDRPTPDQILIFRGSNCNGEFPQLAPGGALTDGTTRSLALLVRLDNGATFYCVDNS